MSAMGNRMSLSFGKGRGSDQVAPLSVVIRRSNPVEPEVSTQPAFASTRPIDRMLGPDVNCGFAVGTSNEESGPTICGVMVGCGAAGQAGAPPRPVQVLPLSRVV